jgi:hypothetical protein
MFIIYCACIVEDDLELFRSQKSGARIQKRTSGKLSPVPSFRGALVTKNLFLSSSKIKISRFTRNDTLCWVLCHYRQVLEIFEFASFHFRARHAFLFWLLDSGSWLLSGYDDLGNGDL